MCATALSHVPGDLMGVVARHKSVVKIAYIAGQQMHDRIQIQKAKKLKPLKIDCCCSSNSCSSQMPGVLLFVKQTTMT